MDAFVLPEVLNHTNGVVIFNKPRGYDVNQLMQAVKLAVSTFELRKAATELLGHTLFDEIEQHGIAYAHRLDKGTSGVWVAATTKNARSRVGRAIHKRRVRKFYTAITEGCIAARSGTICQALSPSLVEHKTIVNSNGKTAVTHYNVVASGGGLSLLDVEIETGRRHQIRAHLSDLGTPIVGDQLYGYTGTPQPICLHSTRMEIFGITFTAPLPDHMKHIAESIRSTL
jgi:23S rRNA pseudouridine1911/1915/1917 synthase